MEDIEQLNSDVQSEASSEPQSDVAVTKEQSTTPEAEASESKQSEDVNRPFHEHPRFQELVQQKNQYAEQVSKLEQQVQQMLSRQAELDRQAQAKATPDPRAKVLERLQGIDPEFAEMMKELAATPKQLAEIREWREQAAQEQTRSQAMSQIQQLHTEHKVTPELQKRYEREIRAIAAENPRLGLQDLPKVYKQIHEDYTKLLDSVKRSERESYVSAKKSDNSAPTSQPKGAKPGPAQKKFSSDPAEAKRQTTEEVLNILRSERKALS